MFAGKGPEGARGGGGGIPAATFGLTLIAAAGFRCCDFTSSAALCASAAFWALNCLICSLDCKDREVIGICRTRTQLDI